MENLTESQLEALKQFKMNVSDILSPHHTDSILIKWLRARNYNTRKAEIYFREMHAFTQVYEIDKMCEKYVKPEVAEKYENTGVLGFAKDGSIVRYARVGKTDVLGLLMSMSNFSFSKFMTHILEQDISLQRKEFKRTGKEINEITYVFDMEGFVISNILHKCVLETLFDLGLIVQDYYPDIWGNVLCINAPLYYGTAYNIFKPIFTHSLKQKIQVASKESSPKLLLKYIDADQLPVFLGGNRVDSPDDMLCSKLLKFGCKVPAEYYVCNLEELLMPSDRDVQELWVSPRGVYNHCMIARKPGGTFQIAFRTENGSIHLRIFHRKLNPESEDEDVPGKDEYLDERDEKTNVKLVSPGMWIQSHLTPVDDTCKAPWAGIYIFRFTNSHSLFGPRRLIYKIELIESDS